MTKRLIVNADDFGLSRSVNEAVFQAHKNGILTSTTIMMNMPAADDAVKIAQSLPKLGVGVHLNLSKGKRLSKDRCTEYLVDDNGEFKYSPVRLAAMSMVFHSVRKAIRTELAEQIQKLINSGIIPTHLDSHKHLHCYPPIYSIVCDLARIFKIKAVRWCYEPKEVSAAPWPLSGADCRRQAALIRKMAKINRFQENYFIKTDAFFGLAHLGKIDVSFLKSLSLYGGSSTAELMCHPATEDEPQKPFRAIELARRTEMEALCDERVKKYFTEAGFELINYSRI